MSVVKTFCEPRESCRSPVEDKQFVVQAVHMLMEANFTKPWSPNENRESRLVFIGRNIDELELRQRFDACIA